MTVLTVGERFFGAPPRIETGVSIVPGFSGSRLSDSAIPTLISVSYTTSLVVGRFIGLPAHLSFHQFRIGTATKLSGWGHYWLEWKSW